MSKKQLTQKEKELRLKQQTQKFIDLATKRTNNIIIRIHQLAKLSSANYKHTPQQIDQIFSVLADELKLAKGNFDIHVQHEQLGFKFK